MQITPSAGPPPSLDVGDLGPLAWVLEEIRKSLGLSAKSIRRFLRDVHRSHETGLSELDTSPLRMAGQQLHQAVGALGMVGLPMPAKLLTGMEALVEKIIQSPEVCTGETAQKMEVCGFSVLEFLQGVLRGKTTSAVALFPQYRDIQLALGTPRLHPADLFDLNIQWADVPSPAAKTELTFTDDVRTQMDAAFLKMVQGASEHAAQTLYELSLGLATTQRSLEARTFWKISAAFFEALSQRMLPLDAYVKSTALQILLQYVAMSRQGAVNLEGVARELLFFCAQAVGVNASESPVLAAVRSAYGLDQAQRVDYESRLFGRVEPAILQKIRKYIATATEAWSAYSGGDLTRLRQVNDQFQQITQSVVAIHPEQQKLAAALNRAVEQATRTGQPPSTPIAMEVATAILYLESAYDDMDPTDSRMNERGLRLAKRLDHVAMGGEPRPLESWMEDLYRRVSDRQTMGSVVDELRSALRDIESALDQYFRQPSDQQALQGVPEKLSQMRGVLSVLGLDQASLAMVRMREQVDRLLSPHALELDEQSRLFAKMGNSVGALGFFIDMLSYQRALAKQLFVFDDSLAEFRPLMGREPATPLPLVRQDVRGPIVSDSQAPMPMPGPERAQARAHDPQDDAAELQEVFLQEAREVITAGLAALQQLARGPEDAEQYTVVRRSFHSLKGGSRMVGLPDLGEAAWALEQLLNLHLAEPLPDGSALQALCSESLGLLSQWIEAIAAGEAPAWGPEPFKAAADAMRLQHQRLAIELPVTSSGSGHQAQTSYRVLDVLTTFQSTAPVALEPGEKTELVALSDMALATVELPLLPELQAPPLVQVEVQALTASDTDVLPEATPAERVDVAAASLEITSDVPADLPAWSSLQDNPDDIKVIGDLQVSARLYNVYLNEADEWSRQLLFALQEWLHESDRPLSDDCISWAHSLAGSSATVGFMALSEIARALEHALQHLQLQGHGRTSQARTLVETAEHIRHLLHQFAAGFLKNADEGLLLALDEISNSEFESTLDPIDSVRSDHLPLASAQDDTPALTSQGLPTTAPALMHDHAPVEIEDAIDPELFPIFEEEARELLPQLAESLRLWTQDSRDVQARLDGLRVLHTLKGSARLAGAMRLGELVHRMESVIEQLGTDLLEPEQIESLLLSLDELQQVFESLRSLLGAHEGLTVNLQSGDAGADTAPVSEFTAPGQLLAAPAALQPRSPSLAQTVRVRAQLLDRLLNQAGEVMISRSRLDARVHQLQSSLNDLTGNLDKLRTQLRDIELQSETQMQSRMALSKDTEQAFDPLEFDRFTRVQELTRMMAESVNDVGTVQRYLLRTLDNTQDDLVVQARQARELQQDLLRTRMVEFDSISERLYAVVRQASKDSGKQVRLDIQGGRLEIDRGVLDRMAPSFEHLLRNAVAHGIEEAPRREAQGKHPVGAITMDIQHEGNDVSVTFSDDGAGLDLQRIREKAVSLGLFSESAQIPDEEAASLIFLPGFTTASSLTELSGRGIGMDVVRSEVASLGGRIETATQAGQGTRFTLILPLTTAVTQVLMLRFGGLSVGVPANLVEIVLRAKADEVQQAYQSGQFALEGEPLPFFWAGALLQSSARSRDMDDATLQVVVIRSAGQRVAIHVDEVLGNQEVVVKHLGPQLSRLSGLTGMSVLASGAVVLIYNFVAMATVYGEAALALQQGQADTPAPLQARILAQRSDLQDDAEDPNAPLILVVDDSITVRRVTQRLLKREGFRVALANDGVQALERLAQDKPRLVLTDIEMPRMDGYDLVEKIRHDPRWADLPIIMITSRLAEKHIEHARELGVNHYLGKPYPEDELLGLIKGFCDLSQPA